MPAQTRVAAQPPPRQDMSVILVTGSYDKDIRFWEAWSGICSRTISRTNETGVRLPALSPCPASHSWEPCLVSAASESTSHISRVSRVLLCRVHCAQYLGQQTTARRSDIQESPHIRNCERTIHSGDHLSVCLMHEETAHAVPSSLPSKGTTRTSLPCAFIARESGWSQGARTEPSRYGI